MSNTSLTRDQIMTLLEAAPGQIAEYTAGRTEARLHAAALDGEWSANEVLAHLRSCADVWGNCVVTILNEDAPTIRAINPRTWIRDTDYHNQEFRSSLRAFTVQRAALLEVLKPLKPKAWERSATISGAGKPLIRTVHFYAEWLATHERAHLKQIQRMADP